MNINSSFNFVPVNANGDNLLQTFAPLTIENFDIVLYDKNNEPYPFYDATLRHPKRIAITGEWGGNDWVCVYLNGPKKDESNTSTTNLRIGDIIHTIKGEWNFLDEAAEKENNYGGISSADVVKVWFDDKLVYNSSEAIGVVKITF
jgi:hypothetical protein